MTVAALVLGAGSGERFRKSLGRDEAGPGPRASTSKAFVRLGGRSLLARSIEALAAGSEVDRVVPVLAPDALDRWASVRADLPEALLAGARLADPVAGGPERQDSVGCGLASLASDVTHVAVHDAARPLVRPHDVDRVVRAGREYGAALLAVPVRDTIKRVVEGRVLETPPRGECWCAQTPQVFRIDWLREALAKACTDQFLGTDDAELVARLGVEVHVVEGDPANLKVTRAEDLAAAEAWLRAEVRL